MNAIPMIVACLIHQLQARGSRGVCRYCNEEMPACEGKQCIACQIKKLTEGAYVRAA